MGASQLLLVLATAIMLGPQTQSFEAQFRQSTLLYEAGGQAAIVSHLRHRLVSILGTEDDDELFEAWTRLAGELGVRYPSTSFVKNVKQFPLGNGYFLDGGATTEEHWVIAPPASRPEWSWVGTELVRDGNFIVIPKSATGVWFLTRGGLRAIYPSGDSDVIMLGCAGKERKLWLMDPGTGDVLRLPVDVPGDRQ